MKLKVLARPSVARNSSADGRDLLRQVLLNVQVHIAERIYVAIVTVEYLPSERIREDGLDRSFGMSRGPVREVLRILEHGYVVRVMADRGAYVSPMSAKELNDIFEIRRVLASAIVRRLGHVDSGLLALCGEQVSKLEQLAGAADQSGYITVSVALGLTQVQASENERLAEIMGSLNWQSWRYMQLALKESQRRSESAYNWLALFNALLRGQSKVAGLAIEKVAQRRAHQRCPARWSGKRPWAHQPSAEPLMSARIFGPGCSRRSSGSFFSYAGIGRSTFSASHEEI